MKHCFVVLFVVYLYGLGVLAGVSSELPLLNVGGFTWAENLAFDLYPGRSQLYVTDNPTGEVWTIVLNSSSNSYVRQPLIRSGPFKSASGLQMSSDNTILYANVQLNDANHSYAVVAIDPLLGSNGSEAAWRVLSLIPYSGNGLALDPRTGFLYSTYEAYEIPGAGAVMCIDTLGQLPTTVVASGLQSTDGCRFDDNAGTLYVSNVAQAIIDVFLVPSSRQQGMTPLKRVNRFKAPGMKFLDDFALSPELNFIWGADFAAGHIVRFNADGSSPAGTVVVSGLLNPTSVQIGAGANFNHTSIYITEGGGVPGVNFNRRVLQSLDQVPSS